MNVTDGHAYYMFGPGSYRYNRHGLDIPINQLHADITSVDFE